MPENPCPLAPPTAAFIAEGAGALAPNGRRIWVRIELSGAPWCAVLGLAQCSERTHNIVTELLVHACKPKGSPAEGPNVAQSNIGWLFIYAESQTDA